MGGSQANPEGQARMVRVPKENVLGNFGEGYKVAIETLDEGRIGIGAATVRIAEVALEAALQYLQERKQFGKPIAKFQAIQFQLAHLATEVEAALFWYIMQYASKILVDPS